MSANEQKLENLQTCLENYKDKEQACKTSSRKITECITDLLEDNAADLELLQSAYSQIVSLNILHVLEESKNNKDSLKNLMDKLKNKIDELNNKTCKNKCTCNHTEEVDRRPDPGSKFFSIIQIVL